MKKTLLILTILCYCQITNSQITKCEQTIVESYKKEFMTSALSKSGRKVKTGKNDLGKKVSFITYFQGQTNPNGPDNIKEIVLTEYKDKITEFTFNFGSEAFEYGDNFMNHPSFEKGMQYYKLSSKNILNENCKAIYFENSYKVVVINTYDKNVFNVDFDVTLDVSINAWHSIEEIEKEYKEQYTFRTIEELKKVGIDLKIDKGGFIMTNEVTMKMVIKEREAIINDILKKYNSSFHFNFRKYTAPPEQIWDEFYVDPMKYIKVIFENSHNLASE